MNLRSSSYHLHLIFLVLILCQVDFNTARPNSFRSSRRISINKGNKGKRGWNHSPLPLSNVRMDNSITELERNSLDASLEDKDTKEALRNRMWLELEGIPPSRVPVKLNGDLTLECQAVGSPPPMIYWTKDGKPIDNVIPYESEEMTNQVDSSLYGLPSGYTKLLNFAMSKVKSKLPLRCIRPEDEGEYKCVADNEGRQMVTSTIISIENTSDMSNLRPECDSKSPFVGKKGTKRAQPAFVLAHESLHMEAIGNNIVLPCRSGGKPRPSVLWTDSNGQTITPGKKFQVTSSGDLVIKNLSWGEMGEFTCMVENMYGSDAASTFLYPLLTDDS